jgi:secreted trypsin-like serine protease
MLFFTADTIVDFLRYTTVRIITNAVCRETFPENSVIETVLCAVGDPNPISAACGGDSGGPLAIPEGGTWTLVGVVSFGSSSGCDIGHPTGFMRTSRFLAWINSITGIPVRP